MKTFWQSLKSLGVGGAATIVSFGSLWVMVHLYGWTPKAANIPSLALGSLVQFFGNRQLVFLARHHHAPEEGWRLFAKQIAIFFVLEIAAFALSAWLFDVLVGRAGVHYLVARVITTSLVFWGFSFPLWKRLF